MNLLILFTLLLELVIKNLDVVKGHTEFWGSPMVLYCTVINIIFASFYTKYKMYVIAFLIFLIDYRVDRQDLHLSGLEAFSFDYVVKWPVSLVLNRKVRVVNTILDRPHFTWTTCHL